MRLRNKVRAIPLTVRETADHDEPGSFDTHKLGTATDLISELADRRLAPLRNELILTAETMVSFRRGTVIVEDTHRFRPVRLNCHYVYRVEERGQISV
jgi:hypothetical protein